MKKEYARSKSEIKNRWRKQLKFSTLDIATLKLGDTLSIINDRIYNESIAIVKKNTEDYFEFITDLDRDDWYSNYLNAFLTQLDLIHIIFNLRIKKDSMLIFLENLQELELD